MLTYGWAALAVVACTALDALLYGHIAEANLIMIYLLGVLPVALRGERGAAIVAGLGSVAAYDLFFVPPFYSIAVSDPQFLITFGVMGLVGLTISTLTARLAAEIAVTRQRERNARALHALGQSLLAAREPREMLAEGARVIGRELGLPVAAWSADEHGEPLAVVAPASAPTASEREVVRGVLREGLASGPGTGVLPGSALLVLPVRSATHVLGALAVSPDPGPDVRSALATGAGQLAIAIDQARAREEAATERLRGDLLGSISHDLRTPLAGIVGAASSLVSGAEALSPETRRELAQGVVEEADRLNRLVTNLLNAARLSGGASPLARGWCDLDELVAAARERLPGLAVEVRLPPELPSLHADAVLLEQVFFNLLDNARQHAPGSPVTVEARQEGAWLVVELADRGPGLPPEVLDTVFDKFTRGPGSRGTGLGLAVCRGVVVAHGGAIAASRRPGGGTAFRFTLPVEEAA